jgi:hypothetical protein
MDDPVLQAHCWAPLIFTIGGAFSPISIRDQQYRSQVIVDRAVEQKYISNSRDLLIVGAGAAGATAAMQASKRGIKTLLVESEPAAFSLQSSSSSRWIDPYLYTYPLPLWESHDYPASAAAFGPVQVPLEWSAGISLNVAGRWTAAFRSYHGALPADQNEVVTRGWKPSVFSAGDMIIDLTHWHPPGGYLEVMTHRMKLLGLLPRIFGMMLICSGFPAERRKVGEYVGRAFWETDLLLKQDIGLAGRRPVSPTGRPTIVISGAGDGALQDLLRAATGCVSPRDLLDPAILPKIPDDVRAMLYQAEDQASRSYSWSTPGNDRDHMVFESLDAKFRESVAVYIKRHGVVAKQNLSELMNENRGNNWPIIHFIHCCSHFSQSYGLNRFLVFLLIELFGNDLITRHENRAIWKVEPHGNPGHACNHSNPSACYDEPHDVYTQENAACVPLINQRKYPRPIACDVLVIRHGPNYPAVKLPRPRHMLPYYLEWPI